jgi:hypothetical protein
MKGTPYRSAAEAACASEVTTLERSAAALISALLRIVEQAPSPVLWPDSGMSSEEAVQRREWSQELEQHFCAMRRRARHAGTPEALLPMFEQQLSELEATVRGAITGRLSLFFNSSDFIRQVEAFQKRWVPWIEPPPAPPRRVRYNESDRSVWLDGQCIARELDRKQFGFVRVLVDRYPDPVTWNVIAQAGTGCRGGNQTRLRNSLPWPVGQLVESGPDGYALRLPEKLSTAV